MYGLTDSELKTIKETLQNLNIKKAILFGSRAKGDFKRGSDVDLAVDTNEKKANYLLNEETNLPYFFDVINLSKIKNENLLSHIKRVGKRLV